MTDALGGDVTRAPHREYGLATVTLLDGAPLFQNLPPSLRVWASHGDYIAKPPAGFDVVATSANTPVAAMQNPARRLYGLLFHPEVAHTDRGSDILHNFAFQICGSLSRESLMHLA